jgi:hypothetical protein
MRENCTYRLSGGRWLARKRATSDPTPMKGPNNDRTSSAEGLEGRAQTGENIVRSHVPPTQSGTRRSQGLDGVRQAASVRKQERFTALLHHLSLNSLRDSFFALKQQAAPRVDGVTWQEYETGLEGRLSDLHSKVHRGAYRARPSRRVYIPKADGRQRPLGIAALEDKIVQQAVVTILNQIYEGDFKGFSYGFRPGPDPRAGRASAPGADQGVGSRANYLSFAACSSPGRRSPRGCLTRDGDTGIESLNLADAVVFADPVPRT